MDGGDLVAGLVCFLGWLVVLRNSHDLRKSPRIHDAKNVHYMNVSFCTETKD